MQVSGVGLSFVLCCRADSLWGGRSDQDDARWIWRGTGASPEDVERSRTAAAAAGELADFDESSAADLVRRQPR